MVFFIYFLKRNGFVFLLLTREVFPHFPLIVF